MARDQIVHQFGIDNFRWIQNNTSITAAAQAAWAIVTAIFNDTQHAVIEVLTKQPEDQAKGLNGNRSNDSNGNHSLNDTNETSTSNSSYEFDCQGTISEINDTRSRRRRTLTKTTFQINLTSDTNVLDVLHQVQINEQTQLHLGANDQQVYRIFSNNGVSDLRAIVVVQHNQSPRSNSRAHDDHTNGSGTTRLDKNLLSQCPLVVQINIQDGRFHLGVDPIHPNTSSFPVQRLFQSFESIMRQIHNANLANVRLSEVKAHSSHGVSGDWTSSATVSVTEEESKDAQTKLQDAPTETKEENRLLQADAVAASKQRSSPIVENDAQRVDLGAGRGVDQHGTTVNGSLPLHEVENKLRQIWSEILNVPISSVLPNVPFVQLGGDSISAMQIVSRCRTRGLVLTIGELLRSQTIENVARSCTQARSLAVSHQGVDNETADLEETGEFWDLSPIQSMYFRDQAEDLNDFNQSFLLRLRRRVQIDQLQNALIAVVERHDMLRARFNYDGWRWTQRVAESGQHSFSFVRHQVSDIALAGDLVVQCQSELDIVNGPVFSAVLFEIPGSDQVLFLTAHHLVIDLVSWRIIWSDLEDALLRKELAAHKPLTFRTWCGIQRKQVQRLTPQQVLPAPVEPSHAHYWGSKTNANTYGNAKNYVTFLDVDATALLMGLSNSGTGTESLDVLVATLISTFGQVFTDRRAPPVFLEGHGRDALNSDSQRDLSETVGWFTTIFPVQTPAQGRDEDIFQMVKFVKDWRRKLPGKGQPYFAYRYLGAHREIFSRDWPIEVLLNFGGTYQQLENDSGLFQREDRLIVASETAPSSYRAAIIEVEMEVVHGQMRIQFGYHQYMKHQGMITQWADVFRSTLATSSAKLAKLSNMFTPSDFDLLNKSYAGLDDLLKRLNASGILLSAIEDIIPSSPVQQDIILSTMKGTASYANAEILTCAPRLKSAPKIEIERLREAWRAVVARHSILSTIFVDDPETGRPLQVVLKDWALQTKIYTTPCTASSPAESLLEIDPPVFSDIKPAHVFTVCQSATGEVACRLDISHALYDHSAVSTLVKDISQAYNSPIGQAPKYRDYIAHIFQTSYLSSIKYWKSELQGVKSCVLSNPCVQRAGHATTEENHGLIHLSKTLTTGIAEFCKVNNITRGVFIQLVWSLVLSRYTGHSEVCFGNLADSRDLPIDRVEEIVGPFLSILVSRVDLKKDMFETMDEIRNRSLDSLDHRNVSMADLLREIGVSGGRLFNTCISVVQAQRHSEQSQGNLVLEEYHTHDPHEFDVTLGAEIEGSQTSIYLTYRKSFASQHEAQRVVNSVETAIRYVLSIRPSDNITRPDDAFFHLDTEVAQNDFFDFWRQNLSGFDAESFPILPSATYQPLLAEEIVHEINDLPSAGLRYSLDVVLLGSWATLQSQYLNSTDIVFGYVHSKSTQNSGSAASFAPLRLITNKKDRVEDFLKAVHDQVGDVTKYAKAGLPRIMSVSSEANRACQMQTVIRQISTVAGSQDSSITSDTYNRAVEIAFEGSGRMLRLVTKFDVNVIDRPRMQNIMQQLTHLIHQFCSPLMLSQTLRDIELMSPEDLCQIWDWNVTVPESSSETVIDIIAETTQVNPDLLAIDAWNGRLTYRELDIQSTKLAKYLKQAGVKPGVIVPLCFEKSKWMPVAQMAVMKAGGASVALDVALPVDRLRYISRKVKAFLILTSHESSQLTQQLAGAETVVATPEEVILSQADLRDQDLGTVSPSDSLVLAFTSGSTGLPKGAILTHSNLATALRLQTAMAGMRFKDRVYDFAAYSFDLSWFNVLRSFTVGATLCIPSEDQRKNNLQKSIAQFEATFLIATPSVASVLDPKSLPSMRCLLLAGEAARWSHFEEWAQNGTQIITGYGPAECTPLSGGGDAQLLRTRDMWLGNSCGTNFWVVDPEDQKSLSPIGSIGELWIEGPLVGRGYISDPEKTAVAFIENPEWLLRGTPQHRGRQGRCYRTGDLVRLDPDGTLTFIGRQDSQVKIRGQRVELSEVEHHIRALLTKKHDNKNIQIVADVIKPQGSDTATLVAFVRLQEMIDASEAQLRAIMTEDAQYLKEVLYSALPIYMVPAAYVPVTHIPIGPTGKTDRRRMRSTAEAMTTEQLFAWSQMQNEYVKPETSAQKRVQRLWAKVMNKDAATIGLHDNFFQLGGDSLLAMRLVGEARSEGLTLSVAKIFKHPLLVDQANIVNPESGVEKTEKLIPPFALLPNASDPKQIVDNVAKICDIEADSVEDIFPCTPLQEGLLALTEKRPGDYVARVVLKLEDKVTEEDFCHAWNKVVASTPILRTYIADDPTLGLVQIIAKEEAVWNRGDDLQKYLKEDEHDLMQIGKRLSRYGIVKTQAEQQIYFIWTCHHAVYDGLSMNLLLQRFEKMYRSGKCEPTPQFQSFVQHVLQSSQAKAIDYWRQELEGTSVPGFPTLPSTSYEPRADAIVKHQCNVQWPRTNFTKTTFIRAAWSILMARYSDSDDAVFGVTVTGRQAPIPGIEVMLGPTLATVPLRVVVRVAGDRSITNLLQQVQNQALDLAQFEQTGLQKIRQISSDADSACQFQVLLLVQPAEIDAPQQNGVFEDVTAHVLGENTGDNFGAFDTYALVLECQLQNQGVELRFNYDSLSLSAVEVERLAKQFEHVLVQLCSAVGKPVNVDLRDIVLITSNDVQSIRSWNNEIPEPVEETIHNIFSQVAKRQPETQAVRAWDGDWTYSELDQKSTEFARELVGLGVNPGMILPLWFEKSKWMPIAALGVMKAGAASVGMDINQPQQRLQTIIQQVSSPVVLCSKSTAELAKATIEPGVVVLCPESIFEQPLQHSSIELAHVDPNELLYVVFTSGSTGTPKGVMISHRNIASAILYQRDAVGIDSMTRSYDFASYAFDVSWSNFIMTLSAGGTLCVPSEHERRNDLEESMRKMAINYVDFTSSAARLIDPSAIPSLKRVNLGGEPVSLGDNARLNSYVDVRNAYGPSECTVNASVLTYHKSTWKRGSLGPALGLCSWIVDIDGGSRLTPLGCVGELWLEGPLVGKGYYKDAQKTASAFVNNPAWALQLGRGPRKGPFYKTGDLVKYGPSGDLLFVGRKDAQVKIRGQRVELGEVEHHVRQCMPVQDAERHMVAEVVKPKDSSSTMLVMFIAIEKDTKDNETVRKVISAMTEGIEEKLREVVPAYMVPSAYIAVKSITRTATGKDDRKKLRELASSMTLEQLNAVTQQASGTRKIATSAIEGILQEVWKETLNLSEVLLDVPFVRLGGDSISGMQVVHRCRAKGISVTLGNILRLKTIERIAIVCVETSTAAVSRVEEQSNVLWDLSPIQKDFFVSQPNGLDHFNQSSLIRLKKYYGREALSKAVEAVVARHPMLRARYQRDESANWKQMVTDNTFVPVAEHNVQQLTDAQRIINESQEQLDIMDGPVFKVDLFTFDKKNGRRNQALFLVAHHLVIDIVSWNILLFDLEQLLKNQAIADAPRTSFRAWSSLLHDMVRKQADSNLLPYVVEPSQFRYWGMKPEDNNYGGTESSLLKLDRLTTEALLSSSNNAFATETVDLLTAALLFSFSQAFTDRTPPSLYLEGHGRETGLLEADLSETIGWFTTMYPIQLPLQAFASVTETIKYVKDLRRSVADNGLRWFTQRHLNTNLTERTSSDDQPEVVLNFAGVTRKAEDLDSIFEHETELQVGEDIAPRGKRSAFFEIEAEIANGVFEIDLRYHRNMKALSMIKRWGELIVETMKSMAETLPSIERQFTISDFPLIKDISYTDLDELLNRQLVSIGVNPAQIEEIIPCSPLQQGMLLSSAKGAASYTSWSVWSCSLTDGQPINVDRLAAAWKKVVSRHSILSTVFVEQYGSGSYFQVITKAGTFTPTIAVCTSEGPPDEYLAELGTPEFSQGTPMHIFKVCMSLNGDVACRLDINHSLIDAASTPILISDLYQAYEFPDQKLTLAPPFRNLIEYLQQIPESERLDYWTSHLQGVSPCHLMRSSPRVHADAEGSRLSQSYIDIPREATNKITEFCKARGYTRAVFVQIAWALTLSRLTGLNEACFGYVSAGRDVLVDDVQDIVGPFVNILVGRISLNAAVKDIFTTVEERSIDNLNNQHTSFPEVMRRLKRGNQQLFNTGVTVREDTDSVDWNSHLLQLNEIDAGDPTEFDVVLSAALTQANTSLSLTFRKSHLTTTDAHFVASTVVSAVNFLLSENSDVITAANAFFEQDTGFREQDALGFWQTQLTDSGLEQFPSSSPQLREARLNREVERSVSGIGWSIVDFSEETIIKASLAILQMHYTDSEDVFFSVAQGERQSADTWTHSFQPQPQLFKLSRDHRVGEFLANVEQQSREMTKLQKLGLQRICAVGAEGARACDSKVLLAIQPLGKKTEVKSQTTILSECWRSQAYSTVFLCQVRPSGIRLTMHFDSQMIDIAQAQRLIDQLECIMLQISSSKYALSRLGSISGASQQDVRQVWRWNSRAPVAIERCVHDVIADTIKSLPTDAQAVCAWDGNLTYKQLNEQSTSLAYVLAGRGVKPGVVVPLFFEKSKWTIVAILAVMKAGAASSVIDVKQSEARKEAILNQIKPILVVASKLQEQAASQLCCVPILNIEDCLSASESTHTKTKLPTCSPTDRLYLVFTSGSTGTPKGAMITHRNFSSAVRHQAQVRRLNQYSRVFQYASYAFDAAWGDILHGLCAGACICIPSEEDRMSDVTGAVQRLGANSMDLTPSVARLINPQDVKRVRTLILAGEPVSADDVSRWTSRSVAVGVAYGPAECSIMATFSITPPSADSKPTIGYGVGTTTWVVNKTGDNLTAIGGIGELWLEGPLVGDGYFGDVEKTAASFIENPDWLTKPGKGHKGRQGRLYKTGDLVRYQANGSLEFIGRKDNQVKIHGQRVELGEVEYYMQRALRDILRGTKSDLYFIADVARPHGAGGAMLLAFVGYGSDMSTQRSSDEYVKKIILAMHESLPKVAPAYMVPSSFLSLEQIPMTTTGKVDRRKIRDIARAITIEQIQAADPSRSERQAPRTDEEKMLQKLWADVLSLSPDTISRTDNFFRIGGDSITAMKLVGMARQQGRSLLVSDIFKTPRLSDLSQAFTSSSSTVDNIQPFSLLPEFKDLDDVKDELARLCDVNVSLVEDAFPCTALQEGLLATTIKQADSYINRTVLEIRKDVDLMRFCKAWELVVKSNPILRTRIVNYSEHGLVQVVLNEPAVWQSNDRNVTSYMETDCSRVMDLGTQLTWSSIVEDENDKRYFVWTCHHSLYDGWSVSLLLKHLEVAYNEDSCQAAPPFQNFIKHTVINIAGGEAAAFWKQHLEGSEMPTFPQLPSPSYEPQPDSMLIHDIKELKWTGSSYTAPTAIRAAWSLYMAKVSNSDDVVFGNIVTGRQAPVPGIEDMVGPTISTLPSRVKVSQTQTVDELLNSVQNLFVQLTQYEQMGLQNIRKISGDAESACQFQALLLIQPKDNGSDSSSLFVDTSSAGHEENVSDDHASFDNHALVLICQLRDTGLELQFSYDSNVLGAQQVQRIAHNFEHVLTQVVSQEFLATKIIDLSLVGPHDLNQIWEWNTPVPAAADRCVHDLIRETVLCQPRSTAVCAWDGNLTYDELDTLSTRLALYLAEFEVNNTIVPLCFEKSKWMSVAMLAVMKAGAASVALQTSLPQARLSTILEQVNGRLILSSRKNSSFAKELCGDSLPTIVVEDYFATEVKSATHRTLPDVDPSQRLYLIFTSGSTGVPKGVVINHQNISSAIKHQQQAMGIKSGSRVFDFASYAFDISWSNALQSFTAGACLCVPSESDSKNALQDTIHKFKCTWIDLTPSSAMLLDFAKLPDLETINLGGEPVAPEVISQLSQWVNVRTGYGPSECTPNSTLVELTGGESKSRFNIGKGYGVTTWILSDTETPQLVPIGSVGELWLEGPLVGSGYFMDDEKTKRSFVQNPNWLIQGSLNQSGRCGRLYRTGDLVKYSPDDETLIFVGRKDNQVKIRGQRVELAEVERGVQSEIDGVSGIKPLVIAEVIKHPERENAILVSFLYFEKLADLPDDEYLIAAQQYTRDLDDRLKQRLPSYMIPVAFIPIKSVPMTTSSKTDRRQLKSMAIAMTMDDLNTLSRPDYVREEPSTEMEFKLRDLWAEVLKIDASKIGAKDSFLQIGGDSIVALRLIGKIKQAGLDCTVAQLFQNPKLRDLATAVTASSLTLAEQTYVEPLSLVKVDDHIEARQLVADLCGVRFEQVEDIFPCGSLQEGLMAMTFLRPGDYVFELELPLRPEIDAKRFTESWLKLIETTPIMRTRIVDLPGNGLVQVIIKDDYQWNDEQFELNVGLGTPLTNYGIQKREGQSYFLWLCHHAVYDGWSMGLMLENLWKIYNGEPYEISPPLQLFMKHVLEHESTSKDFWIQQLGDAETPDFPHLPSAAYKPVSDSSVAHEITGLQWPKSDITNPSLIRAAWAIVSSRYADSEETIFGAVSAGRQIDIPAVELLMAPTIATVPVRVIVKPAQSIESFLRMVQDQILATTPYEQYGLQKIKQTCAGADRASQFQTLFMVQAKEIVGGGEDPLFAQAQNTNMHRSNEADTRSFSSYALTVECHPSENGVEIDFDFDSKAINPVEVERLAQQLECVIRQLCTMENWIKCVSNIRITSPQDLAQIWSWNNTVPEAVTRCVHDEIEEMALETPESTAICAWDGDFTYAELNRLATKLAVHLVQDLHVGPGVIVPLVFERSKWVPVAMLAVMKAGGASLAMDVTQPEERLSGIAQQIGSQVRVILSSKSAKDLSTRLASDVEIVLPEVVVEKFQGPLEDHAAQLPPIDPSNPVYFVFTSGSTGAPKGTILTHTNLSSAMKYQRPSIGTNKSSRVLDLTSYAFDVAWSNFLLTLTAGGCLCIPSEYDRKNNYLGMAKKYSATSIDIVPSTASLLDLSEAPTINTVILGGEFVPVTTINRFVEEVKVLVPYGPAETTPMVTMATYSKNKTSRSDIGNGLGVCTWIVGQDLNLAPVGCVGELWIEGPLVGNGYYNAPEQTASVFVRDPPFLSQGAPGHEGRYGRLYRTGDIVKYNSDGTIAFVGRKDAQLKIRGQRIELEEIEHHIRSYLPRDVVVEAVTPNGQKAVQLTAFLSGTFDNVNETTRNIKNHLATRLPVYMIPAFFLSLEVIPRTASDKVDRKRLRRVGAEMLADRLAELNTSVVIEPPTTEAELLVQDLWASVLNVAPSKIGKQSTFVDVGGDSIGAMRLVAAAQRRGFKFTVAEVFASPQLSDFATIVRKQNDEERSVQPFAMVCKPGDEDRFVREHVLPSLEDKSVTVSDVYPATSFQRLCVEGDIAKENENFNYFFLDVEATTDALKNVCLKTWNHLDILRTVFLEVDGTMLQAVVNTQPQIEIVEVEGDMEQFTTSWYKKDVRTPSYLGKCTTKFVIFHNNNGARLTLRLSHAQYDGLSVQGMTDCISAAIDGKKLPLESRFADFIYSKQKMIKQSRKWWTSLLEGSKITCLDNQRTELSGKVAEISAKVPAPTVTGYTPADIFTALSACVLGKITASNDVILTMLKSGRSQLEGDLQSVVGPCLGYLPVRARMQSTDAESLKQALAAVRSQRVSGSAYEASDLDDIMRNCTQWTENAKEVGCMIQFQNIDEDSVAVVDGNEIYLDSWSPDPMGERQLLIYGKPDGGEWEISLQIDEAIMTRRELDEILEVWRELVANLQ